VRQARIRTMVLHLRPLTLNRQTRTQGNLPEEEEEEEEVIPLPVVAMLLPSGVPLLPRRGSCL
jgi:hypothetical protein